MKTLEQLCKAALERDANQQAIEYEGRWYDWGEMRKVANDLASLLDKSGVDSRSTIVFAPRNRPSALASFLELLAQGRHIRMLYAFQPPAGLAEQIEQQNPGAVIAAERDFSPEVLEVMKKLGIAGIALDTMSVKFVEGCEKNTGSTSPGADRQIEILTSGTTGKPKQFSVKYSLIEKFMLGESILSGEPVNCVDECPALLYFPIGNITGIHTTVPPLVKGQRMVLLDRFSLDDWHQFVVRFRPEASGIPPAMMQALLDANIPREDLASIKFMGSGAAPLDSAAHREFEKRYGIPILLSYGATEFGGPVCGMTLELHAKWGEKKFGSQGRAYPGFKLRVVNPETGDELPAGEEGILEVVSPRIGQNWIRTSDVAMIDEDGFMYLRGRADGAIMRGGFKILPETIETALLLHPAVLAVSIVAVPDKRVSEVPGAAVELKHGVDQPSSAELEAFLRERLLATHIPVHWRFVETLPKTPSFKIDRGAVRRLFSE